MTLRLSFVANRVSCRCCGPPHGWNALIKTAVELFCSPVAGIPASDRRRSLEPYSEALMGSCCSAAKVAVVNRTAALDSSRHWETTAWISACEFSRGPALPAVA
jgi:hypothetical protein